jgi:sn-glycerol 3-phosphate transport system permease protein
MATDPAVARRAASRRRLVDLGWYAMLVALSGVILFPVYLTLVRSVSEPVAYLRSGGGITPVAADWGIFGRVLSEPDFLRAMGLSVVVSIVIVAGQTVTSILAAYVFAFLEFRGKRLAFALTIGTMLLPIEVTLIANIETVRDLGWFNTIQGLVVPFLATAFGIFLVRQAFLGVPDDLRDAAELDGYGHLRFLTRVAIPLSRPIIGSFVLISFLGAWNQYLWPRFAADQQRYQTIQVALRTLLNREINELNFGFAAATLSAIPLIVVLIVFQRQLIRGLTAGAVKG